MKTFSAEFPNDNPDLHDGTIWMSEEPCGRAVARFAPVVFPVVAARGAILEDEDVPDEDDGADIEIVESLEPVDLDVVEMVPVRASAHETILPPAGDFVEQTLEALAAAVGALVMEHERVDDHVSVDVQENANAAVEGVEATTHVTAEAVRFVSDVVPLGTADREELLAEVAVAEEVAAEVCTVPAAELRLAKAPDPYVVLLRTLADVAREAGFERSADAFAQALEGDAVAGAWRAILRGESDDFGACGAASLDEWASAALARLVGAAGKAPAFRRELRSRGVAAFGLVNDAA